MVLPNIWFQIRCFVQDQDLLSKTIRKLIRYSQNVKEFLFIDGQISFRFSIERAYEISFLHSFVQLR